MSTEKVLVVNRKHIPANWQKEKIVLPLSLSEINILSPFIEWYDRQNAETDQTVKQLISYIILNDVTDDTIAVYQRQGSEKRLHGLYSLGVGGHVNPVDYTFNEPVSKTLLNAARRELIEELEIIDLNFSCAFKGIINEELTKVGLVHTGFVFEIKMNYKPLPRSELKNMHWTTFHKLQNYKLELWSKMAVGLII